MEHPTPPLFQPQRPRFRPGFVVAALAAALATGWQIPAAAAASLTWDGGGANGAWSSINLPFPLTNWSGVTLPKNGDSLTFAGMARLNNNNDILTSIDDLSFAAGAGVFHLNGAMLSVGGTISNASDNHQSIHMPIVVVASDKTWNGGAAGVTLLGGLTLGNHALVLSNNFAVDNGSSDFIVGNTGTAALTLTGASTVSNVYGYLGRDSASSGTMTVSGPGSRWINSDALVIGEQGNGRLDIHNGGAAESHRIAVLGSFEGASGTLTLDGSGSNWTHSGTLNAGLRGQGAVEILNGATANIGNILLGNDVSGSGSLSVLGAGTQLATGGLVVGERGGGTLILGGGGTIVSDVGVIGQDGTGAATVTGPGSTWTNAGDLYLGGISSGGYGSPASGALHILNGGKVTSQRGYVSHQRDSSGVVEVAGNASQWLLSDTLYVAYLNGASGTLDIRQKGYVASAQGSVGLDVGTAGVVNVADAGSQWQIDDGLTVGADGRGTLNIGAGGLVASVNATLGGAANGAGTVKVDGAGAHWLVSDTARIGLDGVGRVELRNGGKLTTTRLEIGNSGYVKLEGGILRLAESSFSGEARFDWNSGILNVVGNASLGDPGLGLLGDALFLSAGKALLVDDTLTIGSGKLLALMGGQVLAKTLNLDGGTIVATTGLDVSSSGNLTGHGTVSGPVSGGKDTRITAGGTLTLGSAGDNGGFNFAGTLDVGGHQVILLAKDMAQLGFSTHLGAGGNLSTVNGATLASGRVLSFDGNASVQGRFANNGLVTGSGGALTFLGDVTGAGGFSGDIVFLAAHTPGNSPATISFGGHDATYDATSVLTLEILGTTPGTEYDQLVDIGVLTFNGTLKLVFGGGFVPAAGTSFQLFDFASFSGALDANHIQVAGFDAAKLDFSRLSTHGTLQVAAVPEAETYALMLAGLAMLAWRARSARPKGRSVHRSHA